jgi:YbbR domain-containing protein
MKPAKIIFHNFWAKIICLVIAVATWFYVFDIVSEDYFGKKQETAQDVMSRYDFVIKELPVVPVFTGESPSGYVIDREQVKVTPSEISVYLPRELVGDVRQLQTEKVDIGEYTRSTWITRNIRSDLNIPDLEEEEVNIYIPVEKAGKGQED